MNKSRSNSTNGNSLQQSEIYKEGDYLNDMSYNKIQNWMRKNYFNRLDQASLRHFQPVLVKESNVHLPPWHKRQIISKNQKQCLYSKKIWKQNLEKEKENREKYPNRYKHPSDNNKMSSKMAEDFKEEWKEKMQKGIRKDKWPKLEKKQMHDPNEIKYDINYIDDVERLYMQPYFDKKNFVYTDYLENKKSKIPFNFIL